MTAKQRERLRNQALDAANNMTAVDLEEMVHRLRLHIQGMDAEKAKSLKGEVARVTFEVWTNALNNRVREIPIPDLTPAEVAGVQELNRKLAELSVRLVKEGRVPGAVPDRPTKEELRARQDEKLRAMEGRPIPSIEVPFSVLADATDPVLEDNAERTEKELRFLALTTEANAAGMVCQKRALRYKRRSKHEAVCHISLFGESPFRTWAVQIGLAQIAPDETGLGERDAQIEFIQDGWDPDQAWAYGNAYGQVLLDEGVPCDVVVSVRYR